MLHLVPQRKATLIVSESKYLRRVLRDRPVRRAISRTVIPSRNHHRRITLNNATSITPLSPARGAGRTVSRRGPNFGANTLASGSVFSANQQSWSVDRLGRSLQHLPTLSWRDPRKRRRSISALTRPADRSAGTGHTHRQEERERHQGHCSERRCWRECCAAGCGRELTSRAPAPTSCSATSTGSNVP
jgi:hypothetical protein